ncbi:MAG: hypothetical protein ACFCUM_08195 [Bacteroidales bacterium]
MTEKLITLFKKIHYRSPLWLSRVYIPIVHFIENLRTFVLQINFIEGEERESGNFLKIAYFGNDSRILNYWAGILFREVSAITKAGRINIWNIDRFTQNNINKADLIIVETSSLTRSYINSGKGFVLPRWLDTLIDVENSLQAIMKNDTQKHINKYGFSCEERFSDDDLQFFYERMFKPYINIRHKDSSVKTDFSYFLKRFRRKDSGLFFLMKDKVPVAASFNESIDGLIKFSGLGILDGNREILNMGAIRALYYYMLTYYKKMNIDIINFGGTSPLLLDGLTQFKLSMRAFPNKKKLFGEKSLLLMPVNRTPALEAVLRSNPFIFITQKDLYRAVFVDSTNTKSKHEFMKFIKRTRYKKIAGTKIFCLNGTTEKISQWIMEEDLPDHEISEFELSGNHRQ